MRGLGVLPVSDCAPPSVDQKMRVGLLTFICLGRVRVVVAPRGRMLPLGGVRVFPVYLRSGRCRCCCVRVGNARSPFWVWRGFRAWWRRGVGDDGMPRDCARCECGHGVSLCLRVVLFAGGCAPCFWRGVLLRLSRCARFGCLFVGCVLLCRVLLVCCGLFWLSAIVWCAFRERSRTWCDIVHAGLCGCAFDGDRGCRLLFTL